MAIEPGALGMRPHVERYDHVGEVRAWVHDLELRWQEEEERSRVIVSPEEAMFSVEMRTTAPPQLVWEFITTPGRRMSWQAGVTDVIVEAKGNRRGVGAKNHCMHGPDAVIEEILDWRPFDYLTDRSTMETPAGRLRFLATWELEPTSEGTILRMRFSAPRNRKERAIMEQMAPMFEGILRENERSLRAHLETEADAQLADRPAEPSLPEPKPDAPFAGIQPIRVVG